MHAISDGTARSDSVKSLTLYDLAATSRTPPGHPVLELPDLRTIIPVARIVGFARKVVMAWGLISLGAVAGMSAYYLRGEPDTLFLASDAHPASEAAAPQVRLAALLDVPVTADPTSSRFALPAPASAPAALPPASLAEDPALNIPPPIVEARLPRPRPEEPIFTGSIGDPGDAPYYTAPRARPSLDPCTALRNLGAPFLFGSRCYRQQTRVYPPQPPVVYEPPPAQQYAPQPYQPPVFVN